MTWTLRDSERARRQGWDIFNNPFHRVIQRLDDPFSADQSSWRFPDDSAAAAYVVGRADAGDKHARKALAIIDTAGRSIGSLRRWHMQVA